MYQRIIPYEIPVSCQGMKVQDYLRDLGYSHRVILRLKEQPQAFFLNGSPAFSFARLTAGDLLQVRVTEEHPVKVPAFSFPEPEILWEDQDILVVSKPAGMAVHPSLGHHGDTLADWAAWHFQQKGQPFLFRAVSRLDRDTSGVLVLARHMVSACLLSAQMGRKEIRRTYLALVCGLCPPQGRINAPIGRAPDSILRRQVDWEQGEAASTRYRRLLYHPAEDLSLVELSLDTGRTHQIRVHMAWIGHPLPGDFLYHPDFSLISRQPLHSAQVEFTHPITGRPMKIQAPLPQDMASLLPSKAAYQFQRSPLG